MRPTEDGAKTDADGVVRDVIKELRRGDEVDQKLAVELTSADIENWPQ